MTQLQRYVSSSSSLLLSHILDRPELVAAVRELSAGALTRLIDRIGLEDAGELVALASTEQLAAMFDEDLWRAEGPGREEQFDPQRFALWLSVMGEAGNEFLVKRLCELPLDLLTLAVHRLVLVVDMDAVLSTWQGASDDSLQLEKALDSCTREEWDEFCLIARDPNAWDDVWNALLLLDREHHDLLRDILERCTAMSLEFINGQGGLYEVLTSDEMLESDALADRDDRRAVRGFVTPVDARSFLELARLGTQPLSERDAITAAYFRAVHRQSEGADDPSTRRLASANPAADVPALLQLIAASDPERAPTRADTVRTLPAQPPKRKRPAAAAGKTRRGRSAPPPSAAKPVPVPVPPPAQESTPTKTLFAAALAELSNTHSGLHAERMEELGYLANVLVAGSTHAGRRLRPVEALEAAVAACSLGLQVWREVTSTSVETDVKLLQSVGCDRLFRAAWPIYQRELVLPARRALDHCSEQLQGESLIRARKLVRDDAVFALRDVCDAAELGLDDADYFVLLALAEALPWLPLTAARDDAPSWVASRDDLARARERLRDALPRASDRE